MHRLIQNTPLRSLTWALLGLVAATALLAIYISVLQTAVQRGEWRATHAQPSVWTTAQTDSRQDNALGDASDGRASDDAVALLPVATR